MQDWPSLAKTSPPLRSRGLPPVLGAVAEDGRSTRRLLSLRLSCRPRSNSRRPCGLKVEQNESLQPVVLYFLYSLNWVMALVSGSGRRSGHLLSISTVGMIPKEIEDASNAARSANKHVCCGMAGRSLWLHDSSKLFRWEKVRPSHRSTLPSFRLLLRQNSGRCVSTDCSAAVLHVAIVDRYPIVATPASLVHFFPSGSEVFPWPSPTSSATITTLPSSRVLAAFDADAILLLDPSSHTHRYFEKPSAGWGSRLLRLVRSSDRPDDRVVVDALWLEM
jgi:hypothetical protein